MNLIPSPINYCNINNFYNEKNPLIINGNTESKVIRIAKQIFSIIIFPIAAYDFLHALGGMMLVPASSYKHIPRLSRITCFFLRAVSKSIFLFRGFHRKIDNFYQRIGSLHTIIQNQFVNKLDLFSPFQFETLVSEDFRFKRITIEVDGYQIDGCLVNNSSANNKRWLLHSDGNGCFYEGRLAPSEGAIFPLLRSFKTNALLFNYTGVGNSSGFPNKKTMIKAYDTALSYLENEKGAKEIIGYGFSIGGSIQGIALNAHELKKDIKYVFIKDRTFSNLSQLASSITSDFLGCLVKLLGWNMDSAASSKTLQATEIILQKADTEENFQEIKDPCSLEEIHDGVIPGKDSLAYELLKAGSYKNKHFLGIPFSHNEPLKDISPLVKIVDAALL